MAGEVVRYALTLEGRQFLQELGRARQQARAAAGEIGNAGKTAGGSIGKLAEASNVAKLSVGGFHSASTALAQAMGGNLVGAAKSATAAVNQLTAAMMRNPFIAAVAVLLALGVALYKAGKAVYDWRVRVREATEDNLKFARSLADIGEKWQAGRDQKEFEKNLQRNGGRSIQTAIENQERKTEYAWDQAIAAARELKEAQSKFHQNDKEIEALKAKRDAAKEEYENQLELLGRYKDMYEEWDDKQKEAIAEARKVAEEAAEKLRDANRSEIDRRKYEAAKDDPSKLFDLAAEKRAAVIGKYGFEDDFQDRLKRGTASEEEIKARREVDDLMKAALDLGSQRAKESQRQRNEAAKEEKDRKDREAKEQEDARKQLNKSREDALVAAGRPDELEARANRLEAAANQRFGEWNADKIMSASQQELDARREVERLRGLADRARGPEEQEEQKQEKPWVEGVVAARGMSIGEVFNNMRGMNGATVRDPNLDANQTTAANTGRIANAFERFNETMTGKGVM